MSAKTTPKCPLCHSPIVTEAATFRDYDCGSSWAEGAGLEESAECRKRSLIHDLAVDDEINRRREHRHFEPDHFGT
jgi:hypothetical protein